MRSPWILLFVAAMVVAANISNLNTESPLSVQATFVSNDSDVWLAVGTFSSASEQEGYVGPAGGLTVYDADDASRQERKAGNVRALAAFDDRLVVVGRDAISVFDGFDGSLSMDDDGEKSSTDRSGVLPLAVDARDRRVRIVGTSLEEPEKLILARRAFGGWKRETLAVLSHNEGPDAVSFIRGQHSGVAWSHTVDGSASLNLRLDSQDDSPALSVEHRLRDGERLSTMTSVSLDGVDHLIAVVGNDAHRIVGWRIDSLKTDDGLRTSARVTRVLDQPFEFSGLGTLAAHVTGGASGRSARVAALSEAGTTWWEARVSNGDLEVTEIDGAHFDYVPAFISRIIFQAFSLLSVLALIASAAVVKRRGLVVLPGPRGASHFKRILACAIDFFLGYLLSALGFVAFGSASLIESQLQRSMEGESSSGIGGFEELELSQGGWIFLAALYVLNVAGGAWLESRYGWTPGKYVMRLRVVPDRGVGRVPLGRAIARRLILFVDLSFFTFIFTFFSSRRQRLGDLAASAMVVEASNETYVQTEGDVS